MLSAPFQKYDNVCGEPDGVESAKRRRRDASYRGGGATKLSARPVATRRADGGCGRSLRWSSSKMTNHRLPPTALISPHNPHLQTSSYFWNGALSESRSGENLPAISIVIPTYNSGRVLKQCLESIRQQDYPLDRQEIIVADAGSLDDTEAIAQSYGARIIFNPLQTGEAGKAAGVREAKNEIVALIDSDNVLPDRNWLRQMVHPFSDPEIVAAEPLEYTHRPADGYITRYCALMGMNDPLCFFWVIMIGTAP